MKLQKITNVAEKLTAVKCYCESYAITSKDLETASMIDADFRNVWEYFKAMFSETETPMTEQLVNDEILTKSIEEANSIAIEALKNRTPVKVEEIHKPTPVEDIPKTEPKHEEIVKKEETDEDEGEEFFQTPYEGFKVSKSGKCKVLKKNGWVLSKPSISKGYLRVSNNGKGYQLARLMVETFIGPYKRNSVVPIYKDGNKQNCSLDNLSLDKISTKITTSQLIRACELICEFVRNHKSYTRWDLISHLAKNNSIGETCYNSIINGNYSRITEKYFIVRGGSFILNTENDAPKTEPKHEETISICDEFGFTKDSSRVREWIRKRLEKNERKFSPAEKVTIVLSYINDGLKNPEEIRKKMYADFGEIFIPISFIMSVLGKKICPELCNKIF